MLKVELTGEQGAELVACGKHTLAGLTILRKLQKSDMLKIKYMMQGIIDPGATFLIEIESADKCDIITILQIDFRGFLFHPRTGGITSRLFIALNQSSRLVKYVNGTGWTASGEVLPGVAVPYPLIDNDKGTRNIYRGDVWYYRLNPPENYGNIDWKGWDVSSDDGIDNAPIVSWKGPQSRYFTQGMVDPATNYAYYGRSIYQSGKIIGTLPESEKASIQGLTVYYYVLGAALTKDSSDDWWKVAFAREYFFDELSGELRVKPRIVAQRLEHDSDRWYYKQYSTEDPKEEHLDGWQILSEPSGINVSAPFLFNASGTEASSVFNWKVYTATIDIDNLSATLKVEDIPMIGTGHMWGDSVINHWEGVVYDNKTGEVVDPSFGLHITSLLGLGGSETFERTASGHRTEKVSGVLCARDYIGDTVTNATIEYSLTQDRKYGTMFSGSTTEYVNPVNNLKYRATDHYINDVGAFRSATREVRLNLGTRSILLHSYNTTQQNTAHRDQFEDYLGSSDILYTYDIDDYDTVLLSGAIAFLDLRHDIAVIVQCNTISSQHSKTDQWIVRESPLPEEFPEDQVDIINSSVNNVELYGEPRDTVLFFDDMFPFTNADSSLYLDLPGWPAYGTDYDDGEYPVYGMQFHFTNYPLGSWAVDRYGNHFYSMLVRDGAYNYLSGGDAVALTGIEGENPVFFPIAPV